LPKIKCATIVNRHARPKITKRSRDDLQTIVLQATDTLDNSQSALND